MSDYVVILIIIAFFGACYAYLRGCEKF